MKVLWISRHRPKEPESQALSDLLGGVEIVPISGTVPNTWALVSLLDTHSPDAVVATLPLDMQEVLLAELKHRGMRPLIRPLYWHRKLETASPAEDEWEFHGCEEILEVRIKTRPLKRTTRKEKQ